MKRILLIGFLLLTALGLSANVQVHIVGGLGTELARAIEHQASSLLTELNTSFAASSAPRLDALDLSDAVRRQTANLWKYAPFRSLDDDIVRNPLVTPTGYQLRGLRLEFAHADGSVEYQEGIVNFDTDGRLLSLRLTLPQH